MYRTPLSAKRRITSAFSSTPSPRKSPRSQILEWVEKSGDTSLRDRHRSEDESEWLSTPSRSREINLNKRIRRLSLDESDNEEAADPPYETTKSFYGPSKSLYINPWQRKYCREFRERALKMQEAPCTPPEGAEKDSPLPGNKTPQNRRSKSVQKRSGGRDGRTQGKSKKSRVPKTMEKRSPTSLDLYIKPSMLSPKRGKGQQESTGNNNKNSKGVRMYMEGLSRKRKMKLSLISKMPGSKKPRVEKVPTIKQQQKEFAREEDNVISDGDNEVVEDSEPEDLLDTSSVSCDPATAESPHNQAGQLSWKRPSNDMSPIISPHKSDSGVESDAASTPPKTTGSPQSFSKQPEGTTAAVATKINNLNFLQQFIPKKSSKPKAKSKVTYLNRSLPMKKSDDKEQMILDAGQKRFGVTQCASCGMLYTIAKPEDEAQHVKFHRKFLDCIKFPGWKKENIVGDFHDGRIVVVSHEDPKYAQKKVEDLRELVDKELGFAPGDNPIISTNTKTFLFVSTEKKVIGVCITEKIVKGYRVLSREAPGPSTATNACGSSERPKLLECRLDPEPVPCGISRVWVAAEARRNRIASRLVDAVRQSFLFGTPLSKEEIAFSDPTPDGKLFAESYSGNPEFLTYKHH